MKKIQLNNPKLGELRFPIEITDAPKFGFIVSASASSAYENGKAVEGQLSKINIGVVNFETAKLLKNSGGSVSDLATINVEYIAENAELQKINPKELIGKVIDLSKAEAGLKWVSRGSGGSWGGIKVIIDKITLVNSEANKGN